ncbi:TraX family protein [Eubacteriaceae bacterium ES3]|nr:TraX family protein [Eubacteriaceae bacterium ES3]
MSTTTIKLIALVLMFFDHIAEFIPGTPVFFHWIGRISAPLFMFAMAWGFHYTHDRKKYLLRMYLFGVLMAIIDFVLNNTIPNVTTYAYNNIFVTLLLVGLVSWMIEIYRKDKLKGLPLIMAFVGIQLVTTALCAFAGQLLPYYGIELIVGAFTANLLFNEGSFIFVLLGVLIYFTKENKRNLIIAYSAFTVSYFLMEFLYSSNLYAIFFINFQWMMIGALPLMLLYNGEKGRGLKYLFYFFYPLHIAILFLIGNVLL